MSDSILRNKSKKIISELRKAVGDENVESIVYNIRASDQPQFYTLSTLTNGHPSLIRSTVRSLYDCGIIFPPNFKLPVRKNWLNSPSSEPLNLYQNKFFFNEDNTSNAKLNSQLIIFDDILNEIHNFILIQGNPFQPIDLVKQILKKQLTVPRDVFTRFINENDWHAGLKPLDLFEEIEDPDSKGELSKITQYSYTKLKYKKGYPMCSGKRQYETLLHNLDWASTEQDTQDEVKSKTANIPQVTDKMENIEDESNDLDVQISRNKNVYRMLLYAGASCASFSPIVADELDKIYPERGGIMVELLKIEPDSIYPIIIKRLRERAEELYLKKISKSPSWCKQLEVSLPLQRTVFRKDVVKRMKPKEINSIKGEKIGYPIDEAVSLSNFYRIAKINMPTEPKYPYLEEKMDFAIRKIVSELIDPQIRDVKVTFAHAACIYCGAYFLKIVDDLEIIDSLRSSSVRTAIEIGITDIKEHGFQHILEFIADSINRRKVKKTGPQSIINCILDISGLLFEINFDKVAFAIQIGHLFFKVLKNFAVENDDEVPFITCRLENGQISLISSSNDIVQISL